MSHHDKPVAHPAQDKSGPYALSLSTNSPAELANIRFRCGCGVEVVGYLKWLDHQGSCKHIAETVPYSHTRAQLDHQGSCKHIAETVPYTHTRAQLREAEEERMARVRTPAYTLTFIVSPVPRSTWWKNCDRMQPANVWWLTGGGLNRAATDVEIDLWMQKLTATGALEECMIPKADWFEI